jgi:uncharacterized glyoxalase superfamily protein PhnB
MSSQRIPLVSFAPFVVLKFLLQKVDETKWLGAIASSRSWIRASRGPEVVMSERPAQVIPNIYVEAIEPVREFYLNQLGFAHMMGVVGKDGRLDFCIVTRAGGMLMFARPQERMDGTTPSFPTARPVSIYVEATDVDRYHDEVKARGVKIDDPLTTQWWGDRTFAVRDPYGYQVWFYQHLGEITPPPGVTVI